MNRSRVRVRAGLATALAALIPLAGACASQEPSPAGTTSSESASGQPATYPMTLESPYGKTTLKKKPERVVVIGPNDAESVVALGVTPVGAAGWGPYAQDTKTAAFAPGVLKIGKTLEPVPGGVDPEEVLKLRPDLIVAVGDIESLDKGYRDLSAIAPVVTYPTKLASWQVGDPRTTLRTIARPLGKMAQADGLISGYRTKLANTKRDNPGFAGKTLTMVGLSGDGLFLFSTAGSPAEKFFTDMGFKANPATKSVTGTIPQEKYQVLDSDVLVTTNISGSTDESITRLRANSLFSRLDVVKKKATVHLDDTKAGTQIAGPLSRPTVISSIWMLDTLPKLLAPATKAADG